MKEYFSQPDLLLGMLFCHTRGGGIPVSILGFSCLVVCSRKKFVEVPSG